MMIDKLHFFKNVPYLFTLILTFYLFEYCSSGGDETSINTYNESNNIQNESNSTENGSNNTSEEGTPSSKIWTGDLMTFVKEDEKDPTNALNQDRITDNVWITRGNNGGQIFNAAKESSDNKTKSPIGTEWAIGTLDKIDDLNFKEFRAAVSSPKSVVGKDLVLHLIDDDVYLSVKFKSWSQGKKGGFSYDRSTK